MKNLIYLVTLFLSFFFISCEEEENINTIYFIPNAMVNGTAGFASFEDQYDNDEYIYFSFDFAYHRETLPSNKFEAYFKINSDVELTNDFIEKIMYGLSKEPWIKINEFESTKIVQFEQMKLLFKEKKNSDISYYYKIKIDNEEINSMLIRIPITQERKGFITIENILNLPERIEEM